jgi:hypothetical protein
MWWNASHRAAALLGEQSGNGAEVGRPLPARPLLTAPTDPVAPALGHQCLPQRLKVASLNYKKIRQYLFTDKK